MVLSRYSSASVTNAQNAFYISLGKITQNDSYISVSILFYIQELDFRSTDILCSC
jgi:hypothetical protein